MSGALTGHAPVPWWRCGRVALAVLLLLPLAFLFAPTVPDGDCLRNVNVGPYVRVIHDCDTASLTSATLNLEEFVFEANPWRTRPVYVVLGALAAFALEPVAVLVRPLLSGRLSGNYSVDVILRRLPHYLALAVINLGFLMGAILLGARLSGGMGTPLAFGLGATIATADIVHAFIWIPHPSFMNVLVPVGCIFAFVQGCRFRVARWDEILLFGLAVAAAVLSYGYVIIWIPATMLGWLFMAWRERRLVPTLREYPRALAFVIASCLPVLLWTALTRFYLNLPVAYEAGLNQFMWLPEAIEAGQPLLPVFADKWRQFSAALQQFLFPLSLYPLTAALLLVAGAATGERRITFGKIARDPVLAGVVVCVLSMLIFNFFQGYYVPRLEQPLIMALFVAVARAAWLARLEKMGTALLLAGAALQLWLAFQGPSTTLT